MCELLNHKIRKTKTHEGTKRSERFQNRNWRLRFLKAKPKSNRLEPIRDRRPSPVLIFVPRFRFVLPICTSEIFKEIGRCSKKVQTISFHWQSLPPTFLLFGLSRNQISQLSSSQITHVINFQIYVSTQFWQLCVQNHVGPPLSYLMPNWKPSSFWLACSIIDSLLFPNLWEIHKFLLLGLFGCRNWS